MSRSELSPEKFCERLFELSPEDRYERLKELDGNELFGEVARLQPSFFQEFLWLEKRAYLKSILIETVPMARMRAIMASGKEDTGPTSVAELVERWSEGDEFWRFEASPGDSGYALIREGQMIAYCVTEINCV